MVWVLEYTNCIILSSEVRLLKQIIVGFVTEYGPRYKVICHDKGGGWYDKKYICRGKKEVKDPLKSLTLFVNSP